MEYFIQWKNRKDIYFKTEDGLILISANLDLSSDGETEFNRNSWSHINGYRW